MELTPAEELLLMSRTPQGRNFGGEIPVVHGVAGGVLLELALHGRIALRNERLLAVNGFAVPPGAEHGGVLSSAVLGAEAEALWKRLRAERRPARPQTWVRRTVSEKPHRRVRAALAERGILRSERHRVLGVFPANYWVEADPAPAAAIRERLADAVHGVRADERTVALVMLLDACGQSVRMYPELDSRERKKRIAKISQGPWANRDTEDTVRAVTKGVRAAISMAETAEVLKSVGD